MRAELRNDVTVIIIICKSTTMVLVKFGRLLNHHYDFTSCLSFSQIQKLLYLNACIFHFNAVSITAYCVRQISFITLQKLPFTVNLLLDFIFSVYSQICFCFERWNQTSFVIVFYKLQIQVKNYQSIWLQKCKSCTNRRNHT